MDQHQSLICTTLRSLIDCIECSSESQLNTSHLCILLTPWNGYRVSSYCTPHSSHTYLHSTSHSREITATIKGSTLKQTQLTCLCTSLAYMYVYNNTICVQATKSMITGKSLKSSGVAQHGWSLLKCSFTF